MEHPKGSQFKGYQPYQVQELVLAARVVCYSRKRWLTPEGKTMLARCPAASAVISARSCAASC